MFIFKHAVIPSIFSFSSLNHKSLSLHCKNIIIFSWQPKNSTPNSTWRQEKDFPASKNWETDADRSGWQKSCKKIFFLGYLHTDLRDKWEKIFSSQYSTGKNKCVSFRFTQISLVCVILTSREEKRKKFCLRPKKNIFVDLKFVLNFIKCHNFQKD